jgi:hypothetical protein
VLDSEKLSQNNNNVAEWAIVMEANCVPPVNKRLCRSGAALASLTAVFLVAGNAVLWLVPQWTEDAARNASFLWTQKVCITPFVRWAGLGVTTLHLCVLVWGLLRMRALFKLLASGEAFVADTSVLLRRFGIRGEETVVALIGALIQLFGSVLADAKRIADENPEII